jgi:predicted nucleic acid-binding Zn finger protein
VKQDKVRLETIKEEDNKTTLYFEINAHKTMLFIEKFDKSKFWKRIWACDCPAFSLLQDKVECKHIKAAELYLMSDTYGKEKQSTTNNSDARDTTRSQDSVQSQSV